MDVPEQKSLQPGYEQTAFSRSDKLNHLCLIASRDGRDGSVTVHQRVDLFACILEPNIVLLHETAADNKVFIQVVSGSIAVNDKNAVAGDGLQVTGESQLSIVADSEAELLLFDMS